MADNTSPSFVFGSEDGFIGICTLWTPAPLLGNKIAKEKFYVCANLFSIEGINTIIRSCLSNPKMRYLVIWGTDSLKAGEMMVQFFKEGVDAQHQIKNTSFKFHKEIPLQALEAVRKNVECIDLRSSSVDAVLQRINSLTQKPAWGKPQEFPSPSNELKETQKFAYQFEADPLGSFVISIVAGANNQKIVVLEHYTKDSIKSGHAFHSNESTPTKIVEDLAAQLISAGLVSRLDHAFYLGKEIQKALFSIQLEKGYTQDQPL